MSDEYEVTRLLILSYLFNVSTSEEYIHTKRENRATLLGKAFKNYASKYGILEHKYINLVRMDIYVFSHELFRQEDIGVLH